MSTVSPETLKKIAKIKKIIREFFEEEDFLEVETPILNQIPGMEPHLDPFETYLQFPENWKNTHSKIPFFLNTSPELQMKKLLGKNFNHGKGFEKIFNLTKVFRNKEFLSKTHNPEFTMLEWYRQDANYLDLMDDCENLIIKISQKFKTSKISLKKPWERVSCRDLFLKYCDLDISKNKTFEKFKTTANQKNLDIQGCQTWDDIFFKLFLNKIERNLGKEKPTFVFDYPTSQAALAKNKSNDPFYAERFELYIDGLEIANAFSELIDSEEQRKRLQEEQKERKKLKKPVFPIDEEFLESLDSITKPTAGIALGIDRLIMFLLNKTDIKDILLFPIKIPPK